MIFRGTSLALLAFALAAFPARAQPEPVESVFEGWLDAFNSGDTEKIQAFYGKRLGDPDARFPIDLEIASCGFEPVRVESRSATSMTVLLIERCFPALQRLTIELDPDGGGKVDKFDLAPFAMTVEAANNYVASFADRLEERGEFAGALLLIHDGKPHVAREWGKLDQDSNTPITLDTPMFLASAAKMFTAVSVLQLVEAGKLDLDAALGTYLIDYPNTEIAQVTIRQLLQHRGGTGDIGTGARRRG